MKTRLIRLAVVLLASSGPSLVAIAEGGDTDGKQTAEFKITTRRADDAVEVRSDKGKTLCTVRSPSGISQMVIERLGDDWPKEILLRLHLKGLERLRVTSGMVTLDAEVSGHEGPPRVRSWKDGEEKEELTEKSPFWMNIRILDGNGNNPPMIPLKQGYFEMTLPEAFFDGNPKSITVQWIDFYRE
jgi:hypothetical protein